MTELTALRVIRKSTGLYLASGEIGPDGEPIMRPETYDIQPGETFTEPDPEQAAWYIRVGGAAPAGSEEAAFAIRQAQGVA